MNDSHNSPASGDPARTVDWPRDPCDDDADELSGPRGGDSAVGLLPRGGDLDPTATLPDSIHAGEPDPDDATVLDDGSRPFDDEAGPEDTLLMQRSEFGEPERDFAENTAETVILPDSPLAPLVERPLSMPPPFTPATLDEQSFAAPMPALDPGPAFTLAPAPSPIPTAPATPSPQTSHWRKLAFVFLFSYASAVTIALVYMYSLWRNPKQHVLESLPDVKPLQERAFLSVPVDAPMPAGHTLRLGEAQRFGNVRVEPLRIVREPAEFVHYTGQRDRNRAATAPVLKLWLRFTNVSSEQSVSPLDADLVFKRVVRGDRVQANNFVCRAPDKGQSGPVVFVYDLPQASEWDLAGQQLGRTLQPGESVETYVATTEEGLDQLTGDLIWRVHFRKGHSPKGNGVTTMVEVAFDSDEITSA